jgi:hypothetical protein
MSPGHRGGLELLKMTTLDTGTGTTSPAQKIHITPAPAVEAQNDTAALITTQQVLLSSAAALAPAPARHRNMAHELSLAVRAMFTRPERPRAHADRAQRFAYLENSAMSREMDRL